jgi:hypothetical protein
MLSFCMTVSLLWRKASVRGSLRNALDERAAGIGQLGEALHATCARTFGASVPPRRSGQQAEGGAHALRGLRVLCALASRGSLR